MKRYARLLLGDKFKWPLLREIELWIDDASEELPLDYRLDNDRIYTIADVPIDTRSNGWKRDFDVDDMIWDQMRESGIAVRKVQHPKAWEKEKRPGIEESLSREA